jgi:hypothetical protein
VPARVAVADGRPVRVTTDRRALTGGAVTHCAGPWRTSGEWWAAEVPQDKYEARTTKSTDETRSPTSDFELRTYRARAWDRDEWDVSLSDGGVYRIFRERDTDRWFLDAIVD